MKRHVSGALMAGTALLAASGCTKDPTAALRGGGPARLAMSAKSLTVSILDSVAVNVTVQDDQGNPLPEAAAATSSAPTIVTVSSASAAPLPQTRFFVKGLLFGQGFVRVAAGSVNDSIRVFAYPAAVRITGTPDSLNSGSSVVLTATPVSAGAPPQPVANVTPITWTTTDDAVAEPTTPGATATVSGKLPGVATITVRVPGGASTLTPLRVVPATFAGSLSASSGGFGDEITATKGGSEPDFSTATHVTVMGHPAFVTGATASTITFRLPPVDSAGARPLWFSDLGPDGLATRTTFTMNDALGFDDATEAATADPTAAPVVTNATYFITLHGACDAGVATGPSDDCDDFFTVTNSTGAPISVTADFDWPDDADVDILWCNAACDAFTGNFNGATGANPESSTVTVAAGATIRLWANLFAAGSDPYAYVRIVMSGLP